MNRQRFTVTCEKVGSPHDTTTKTKTGPPSYAVIQTIAEIRDTGPEHLERLYSVFDPDALDTLFQRTDQDESHRPVAIAFRYEGYDVTINPAGMPTVH